MKPDPIQETPRPRQAVSVLLGNAVQLAGLAAGAALMWLSAQPVGSGARILAMLAGYVLIYLCSHSLLHYCMGRLVGIKFNRYSVGGSAHASSYPLPLRAVFERLPFFAAHTDPASMRAARPSARAIMFAAGITGTIVFCTGAALFACQAEAPGGCVLLVFNIIWLAGSLVAEMQPGGDLGKAVKALKQDR